MDALRVGLGELTPLPAAVAHPERSTCNGSGSNPAPPVAYWSVMDEDIALKHVTLPTLAVVMVIGNGLLIYVIMSNKQLRTVTNLFILSLALSDLLLGAVIVPLVVLAEEGVIGHGSPRTCLSVFCVAIAQVLASCLTLMAIASERYMAIVAPLRHHTFMTTKNALLMIVACWVYSVLVGLMPLLGWNSLHYIDNVTSHRVLAANHVTDDVTHNATVSPPGEPTTDACRYQYVIPGSFAAFMYPGHFVPLWILMFILYGQIYMRSRNQTPKNSSRRLTVCVRVHEQSTRRAKENWRALRILTVIVGYFLFSWLPVVVWYALVFRGYTQDVALRGEPGLPYWFYNVGITLAFGNSAVNPFLYGLGNRSVRRVWVRSCGSLLGACACRRRTQAEERIVLQEGQRDSPPTDRPTKT